MTYLTSEVEKFDRMAADWWDPEGPARPLHDLNPTRLRFIADVAPIEDTPILDVGCGGGLVSEGLARLGAQVTGVDAAQSVIEVARAHAQTSGLSIDYRQGVLAEHAPAWRHHFPVITCLELLEHVPSPPDLLKTMASCLAPGGHLIVSTINRTPQAFVGAIVGAEYLLRLLPPGTHEYKQFIRPSELNRWARAAGLRPVTLKGLRYNPFTRQAQLTPKVGINYLVHFRKDA